MVSLVGEPAGQVDWGMFIDELCRRFGELAGIDVVEESNKFVQEDSVPNYQENFEEMRSLLITENSIFYFYASCGLKEEL